MGSIIPVRGATYHAFSVNDVPLYAQVAGPGCGALAGPPALPPIAAATARRTLVDPAGPHAGANSHHFHRGTA